MSIARPLKPSESPRELPEFIGGLFPRKQISVIASKPGVGKTWFTLLNIRNITNEGLKCVLYNGETGFDIIQDRISLLEWRIPEDLCLSFSSVDAIAKGGLGIDDPKGWQNFTEICKQFKPDAIFIDSLLAFLSGDESDMKSMRDNFTRLQVLAQKIDCAVIVNHHLRKSSGQEYITIDDFIGSSAISRIACCLFSLKNDGEDVITVECLKSWYQKPRTFNFKIVNRSNMVFITNGAGIDMVRKPIDDVRTLLNNSEWVTVAETAAKLHMHPRAAYRCLERLVYYLGEAERRQASPHSKTLEYRMKPII